MQYRKLSIMVAFFNTLIILCQFYIEVDKIKNFIMKYL